MKIADTHTHLYFEGFDHDRETLLKRNRDEGVQLQIQIGCDEISSLVALDLAKKHKDMFCTIGLHPVDIWDFIHRKEPRRYSGYEDYIPQAQTLDTFAEWLDTTYQENKEHIVGFGETGIDLYHQNTPELFKEQIYSFKKHLELCQKHHKTMVIHSRSAGRETLDFLEQNYKTDLHPTVFHCFSETAEYAEILVNKYDMFIGIGGAATYNNADNIREAITTTPIDHIVTETDAPFLTPYNHRKEYKRNESRFLTEVIELIAEIKEIPLDETAEILFANAKKLYQL